MRILSAVLISIVLLAGCSARVDDVPDTVEQGTPEERSAVAKAAKAFLDRLDDGKVDETWSDASPVLAIYTERNAWSLGIRAIRSGVGSLKSRELKEVWLHSAVANSPPGEYATIVCETVFSNAKVQEKVILNKHEGTWKISGYYLVKNL
ncbi:MULTISPECIES: DUF4019 domain-containing protein [unclassified Luteimonas]